MIDPVLVITIGFFIVLCILVKFTGINGNKSEVNKEDGIAVDIKGNPINPKDIDKLENNNK